MPQRGVGRGLESERMTDKEEPSGREEKLGEWPGNSAILPVVQVKPPEHHTAKHRLLLYFKEMHAHVKISYT